MLRPMPRVLPLADTPLDLLCRSTRMLAAQLLLHHRDREICELERDGETSTRCGCAIGHLGQPIMMRAEV